jgi:hypothetical protein
MSAIQITDATIVVNNDTIGVVTGSVKFTEGLGEQKVRVVSIGGGKTDQVYSNDLETNFSKVSFDLPSTVDNINSARAWKINGNENVVQVQGENADGELIRVFTGAALTADYEVDLGPDGNIAIEFQSNSAK